MNQPKQEEKNIKISEIITHEEVDSDTLIGNQEIEENEVKVSKQVGIAKVGAMILGTLLILGMILFVYLFFPLTGKISGDWESEKGYSLVSKGNNWTMTYKNFQDVEGFDLTYGVKWQPRFPNKYEGINQTLS